MDAPFLIAVAGFLAGGALVVWLMGRVEPNRGPTHGGGADRFSGYF